MLSPISQRYLFVVGFFRSGTSLVYNFLNLHPQIRLVYEADFLNYSLIGTAARCGKNWWERLDFYNSCCQRHGLVAQPAWKNVRQAKEAAEILYREYGGSERRYIGEKSPSYYNCLPKIARQFPDARFIVLWRDPQEVVSSILAAGEKNYFFCSHSLPLRSIIGFEQMQADVLALRAREVPIFDLCYEDLVENPEALLRAICVFLEIPFDPGMLHLENADCSSFPPGEHHFKARSGRLMRTTALSEHFRNPIRVKVQAYLSRWKICFGDRLATRRYWPETSGDVPNQTELLCDRINYAWALFTSEQFTPFIYGLCPQPWLQFYRSYQTNRRKKGIEILPASAVSGLTIEMPLKISVITPSYKQLPWLRLCAASVKDQQGVSVEHIIQDAQSGPELEDWVHRHTTARIYVECDSGMYDAINRGFARATGDILCWLNSDEQYLDGALAKVARYFAAHPEIDVLFGDALLVANTGTLLSYRKAILPNRYHIQASHLNTLTCATFVRRSVVERNCKLETRWRAIADAVWIADMLKAKIPMAVLNEPLAVFTITDTNLGQTSLARAETERWQNETGSSNRVLKLYFVVKHRWEKLINGAYWPRSVKVRLYTLASPEKRVRREAHYLGFNWPE